MAAFRAEKIQRGELARQSPTFSAERIDRLKRLLATYGIEAAAEIGKTTPNSIRKLARRGWVVGRRGPPIRPRPTDFVIQADCLTLEQLKTHYRASIASVRRWAAEIGREDMRRLAKRRKELPSDFYERAKRLGMAKAADSMGVHVDTLRKRIREVDAARSSQLDRTSGWAERFSERRAA